MDHAIKVSFIQNIEKVEGVDQVTNRVLADPNPLSLPYFQPGDTVTWLLGEGTVGKNLRVLFRGVLPLDGSAAQSTEGPFSQTAMGADRIVGTVQSDLEQGRYLYDFFAGDAKVRWANPLEEENFGGLDIPQPPPRGA